ncbi:hypothetical protein L2X99_01195 [Microbacterium sp. KUDC0406]|uniref:hypothetical protein n=1 Tax=Microbacterium sp. KUDC0406 TaxID=2909588 RepID=UPI001F348415|nr:hypothetical protein [Microbacterium sp. KUDC0406]UJP10359.1 hypothetical protein L2X99_01195 [Microbacterium sp. KUDC0406]
MADVSLDYAAMEASISAYKNMHSLLDGSTAALGSASSDAIPQSALRDRLHDLHDSWGGGLDKLSRYAEDAHGGLSNVLEAFRSFDEDVAASMEEGGDSA